MELGGATVIPGLIESNGHIVFDGQIDHASFFATRYDQYYEIGVSNLSTTLDQGITTVRDTHGPVGPLLRLKQHVAEGQLRGPRLFVAGAILNYESLLDIPTDVVLDTADVLRARQELDRFVIDAASGRAMIRSLESRGVDFIKISLSGAAAAGPRPNALPDEVLGELLGEARSLGLRTTSHTMNVEDLSRAVRLGFDATEHPAFTLQRGRGVPMPDSLVRQMANQRVYAIPLLVAMEVYITHLRDPSLLDDPSRMAGIPSDLVDEAKRWIELELVDPAILEAREARYEVVRDNLSKLIEAGVPIAMGTDKGTRLNYHEHANHVRELEIYVELGMSPLEAIRSATLRGAELLGVAADLGSIEAGKTADLVVLNGDPTEAIRHIGDVVMVFKNGVRH